MSPTPSRPSGSGRANTMRHITLTPSMEAVMADYWYYNTGIDPDTTLSENVQSKVSRVKNCLLFMGRDSPRSSDWLFPKDTSKIRAWPHDLRENSNLAVTTVAFYIKKILQFIRYLMDSHLKANRLSQFDMHTILRELPGCLVRLHREVTVHQFHVKRRKLDGLPGYGDLEKCLSASVKSIPELLDRMERSPSVEARYLLYGYFSLHWSLLSGHRAGVYANMTNSEVNDAENRGTKHGYFIHVKAHKTANTYGEAQLHCTTEEFGWVQRWMHIKKTLIGHQNRYFL
nr:uncharacterized protein LOC117441898 [Pseudochaenichthys georgianus]